MYNILITYKTYCSKLYYKYLGKFYIREVQMHNKRNIFLVAMNKKHGKIKLYVKISIITIY